MYRDKVHNMQSWTVVLAALKLPVPFISEVVTEGDNVTVNIYIHIHIYVPERIKEDSLSKNTPPNTQLQKYKITKVNQHNNERFIIIIVITITYSVHRPCQSAFSKVGSSASAFKFVHLLISLRSSSSCSRHFPPLLVLSIFPPITCFIRQFS